MYVCGIIGHSEVECEKEHNNEAKNGVKQYGEWLRANSGDWSNGGRLTDIRRGFFGDFFHVGIQLIQKRIEQLVSGGPVETWNLASSNLKPNEKSDESSSIR